MIKAPRGTQDIYGDTAALWQKIEQEALRIFQQAGFQELRTPTFEASELFNRAVGESSDIVNKEMYTFFDRSERSLTLRPEGTAGVVRAFIENAFDRQGLPSKIWYRGPMFRYERPQKGRYRQFNQIGIEVIGAKAPYSDLEIINLGVELMQALEIKNLELHINTLANAASRELYTQALKTFLETHLEHVCSDCQTRFKQNPLRCLDCKNTDDQKIYANAPKILDYLDEESKQIWQDCQTGLEALGIKYKIDANLVRGLDYYNHLVFELKSSCDTLANQNTVLAGGRYDNLVNTLGGQQVAACGWALGIERIASLITAQTKQEKLFIISDNELEALKLAKKLRQNLNIQIEFAFENSKFKKQLEKAIKKSYTWVLFYLEDERSKNHFKVKNLFTNTEYDKLNYQELIEKISNV